MKSLIKGCALFFTLAGIGWADSVQPIVPPAQVLYGSAQKLITSNTDVKIDTTTHVLTASKGIHVSTITFADGTILASTSTLGGGGGGTWGSITGTLSNQTDLQTHFNAVGTSTAALQTQINAVAVSTGAINTSLGVLTTQVNTIAVTTGTLSVTSAAHTASITALGISTGSLQTQITAVAASTGSFQTQITALGVSTGTIQTQVTAIAVSTGAINTTLTNHITAVATSTNTLQTEITALGVSTGTLLTTVSQLSVSTAAIQTQVNALAVSTGTFASATSTGPLKAVDWVTFNSKGALAQSNLAVFNGVTQISSPTIAVAGDGSSIIAYAIGASSAGFKVNPASGTLAGNTFNGASQLVQLTAGIQYPALNGNLITNIAGGNVIGTLPVGTIPGLSSLYINNGSAHQTAVANIDSMTVVTQITAGNMTDTALPPGQCVQTATGGLFSTTGIPCAGSTSLLPSTNTWTGQQAWTSASPSTFTATVVAGGFQSSGSGAAEGIMTEGSDSSLTTPPGAGLIIHWASNVGNAWKFNPNNTSTFTVVGTSVTMTPGDGVVIGNSNGALLDTGAPPTSLAQVQAASGTYTGQNTFTGNATFNGNVSMTNINTVVYSTGVVVQALGPFGIGSLTIAGLHAQIPAFVAEHWYCTDCTVDAEAVSTGTLVGQYSEIGSKTTFPH